VPALDRELRWLRAFALLTYPFVCVPFLFLFFEEHGLGDIFQYTVHNATLRAQVGKLQEAGEVIPSCITVTNSRRARVK
jgi:hypothetical protein